MTESLGPSEGTLSFDLAEGIVRLGRETRLVVPASALMLLWGAASPEGRRAFARALGEAIGRAAMMRLAPEAEDPTRAMLEASPEAALFELAATWGLAGLGVLEMERWGRALVLSIGGSPLGEEGDELCEAALEGALGTASGKDARVVRLERIAARARFFVGSAAATARMRAALSRGVAWAEGLAALEGATPRGDA